MRLLKLKTEGQSILTENLNDTISYKPEIKILAYPGLA